MKIDFLESLRLGQRPISPTFEADLDLAGRFCKVLGVRHIYMLHFGLHISRRSIRVVTDPNEM